MQKHILLFVIAALSLVTCKKEETPNPSLNIPSSYNDSNFSTDAAGSLALRSQLNALVNEAKRGRNTANTVEAATLTSLYTAASPSVQSATLAYFNGLLSGSNGWLAELAKASGTTYTPGIPTGEGGVYGGYLFDENGLEIEQLIEKGLFGAMNYYQAQQLLRTPNAANLNKALALYGAHPSFPNTPTASKAEHPDAHMANYAARRSDSSNVNSLYNQIKIAFITAQAAMEQGADFNAERDAALANIRLNWEKVNAATIINYCHSVIGTMSGTAPTDAQKANALHAYGEAVGFMHGWRNLPADSKRITDTQIDEVLALLRAESGQTPVSYVFITEPVANLPRLQQVISRLQQIYGFSNAEVEAFRNNWVNIQSR
ncbi:MAG: DUF4856 domain-containing protein [Sphingobacteriaceae bacterium]|nr:DUF4856 domain-containing protein [Sphingobacteriaceae bacterium]